QCVSRRQGSDALKQCRGADRVLEGQVFGERRGVGPDVRQEGQQRLRFRSKEQPATLLAIVEWLDSESIASCEQFLVFLIPDRKRKHSTQTRNAIVAPSIVGGKNDLGIGARTKRPMCR